MTQQYAGPSDAPTAKDEGAVMFDMWIIGICEHGKWRFLPKAEESKRAAIDMITADRPEGMTREKAWLRLRRRGVRAICATMLVKMPDPLPEGGAPWP